jgi:hypothetical protein
LEGDADAAMVPNMLMFGGEDNGVWLLIESTPPIISPQEETRLAVVNESRFSFLFCAKTKKQCYLFIGEYNTQY